MLISCGDPAKGPATYTRFILPFAYCPTFKEESNDKVCYEKTETEDLIWRKKYLTYETADVLLH